MVKKIFFRKKVWSKKFFLEKKSMVKKIYFRKKKVGLLPLQLKKFFIEKKVWSKNFLRLYTYGNNKAPDFYQPIKIKFFLNFEGRSPQCFLVTLFCEKSVQRVFTGKPINL